MYNYLMFPMFVAIHIVVCMYLISMYPKYAYPIHSYSIYVWYTNLLYILSVSDKYVYPIHRPHPLVRLHTGGLPWRWRRASCGGGAPVAAAARVVVGRVFPKSGGFLSPPPS